MSDPSSVTSDFKDDLFNIEVAAVLGGALKDVGAVLMSPKGKKALLGDGKNSATLSQKISGGGAEKQLEVTIGTRAAKGPAAGNMVKSAKRPEQVGRKSVSAKVAVDGSMVEQGVEISTKTLAVLNQDFEKIIDVAAQKAVV